MNDALHSTSGFAAERYLLGELTAEEREQFEEHFFSCQECADRVVAAAIFIENAKLVLPEMDLGPEKKPLPQKGSKFRLNWFAWSWAQQAAMACVVLLGGITVYQNAVQIPHLRASAASNDLILSGAQVVTARRAAANLTFSARKSSASLVVTNEWEETFPDYLAEIRQDAQPEALVSSSAVPASGPLAVSIPVARLGPGKYTIILYGVTSAGARQVVARYPFTIEE